MNRKISFQAMVANVRIVSALYSHLRAIQLVIHVGDSLESALQLLVYRGQWFVCYECTANWDWAHFGAGPKRGRFDGESTTNLVNTHMELLKASPSCTTWDCSNLRFRKMNLDEPYQVVQDSSGIIVNCPFYIPEIATLLWHKCLKTAWWVHTRLAHMTS